ncbi:MAG: tRNA lysidine(34) synthetase TilS [Candidatus Phaeomarinobacter sp.]
MADTSHTDIDFDQLLKPFELSQQHVLAVAVSGGPDSMALLLLAAEEAHRSGRQLYALTVDHGLRPEARDEAAQVGLWAASLGVPHTILTHDGPVPEASLQAAARDIRYKLMGEWCAAHGVSALLVGHTQDDQAETLMLRLARGSGVDGLAGITADVTRDGLRILRPLLSTPRAGLLDHLEQAGQGFITDPSNKDTRYARVRMRTLRPLLEAEGLTVERLAETAARLATAKDALAGWTRAHVAACTSFHVGGWAQIDRARLVDVPTEIGLRAVSKLVMAVGGGVYPPRLHQTENLLEQLRRPDFGGATLGGVTFLPRRDYVLAIREARAVARSVVLRERSSVLWDNRFEISGLFNERESAADRYIGALGQDNARQVVEALGPDRLAVPAVALACMPGVFSHERLLEVPGLGFGADEQPLTHQVAFVGPMRAGLIDAPITLSSESPSKTGLRH